jgi:AraC-like DNA-binding protein
MAVKSELEKLGLHYTKVELGEAEIVEDLSREQRDNLSISLKNIGLELKDDKMNMLVEKVQTAIIELVHYIDHQNKVNISEYLSEKFNLNYSRLSSLFSKVKGTTIEKFYLAQKIERVKELLIDDDFSLINIAYKLHYSSEAHLSNQFKKITGLTPTDFKTLIHKRSRVLEVA